MDETEKTDETEKPDRLKEGKNEVDEFYSRIGEKVPKEEFLKRYREVREHFENTITQETALLLAAYSLGYMPRTKISELVNSRGEVSVRGRVLEANFRKLKKGYLAEIRIADESGEIRATLWNEAAELVKVGDLFPGCEIELKGFVKRRGNEIELSVNDASNVEIIEKGEAVIEGFFVGEKKEGAGLRVILADAENKIKSLYFRKGYDKLHAEFGQFVRLRFFSDELLEVEVEDEKLDGGKFFTKISDVAESFEILGTNVRGRVSGIGMLRKIVREDRTIKYAEIYISDETGRTRVLLWGDNTSLFKEVDVGTTVLLLNTRVKNGEIHCGRDSIVLIRD